MEETANASSDGPLTISDLQTRRPSNPGGGTSPPPAETDVTAKRKRRRRTKRTTSIQEDKPSRIFLFNIILKYANLLYRY